MARGEKLTAAVEGIETDDVVGACPDCGEPSDHSEVCNECLGEIYPGMF